MKTLIISITITLMFLTACEKNRSNGDNLSYLEYLQDKTILSIHILDGTKYINTSRYCDTCYVPSYMSFMPTIEEWTVIQGSTYENYPEEEFSAPPIKDKSGNYYTVRDNNVYKQNNGNEELIISTGEYQFNSIIFDNEDNIWFFSFENGIAFWDKTELKIYNAQNSPQLTERIHGMSIDKSGIVWVSLDFTGLLKIENANWTIIPNAEIPGLSEYSYLRGPHGIQENSVWFEVFSPDTTSNILKLENGKWIYEYPDSSKKCNLIQDANEIIWSITNHYQSYEYEYSTLKYFSNNNWITIDVSDINNKILNINSDENNIYIGTTNGLIEKTW